MVDNYNERIIKEYFFCSVCDTFLGTETNYVNLFLRNLVRVNLGSKRMDNKTARSLIEVIIDIEMNPEKYTEYKFGSKDMDEWIAKEDKRIKNIWNETYGN